jgi:hypothetical protein
MKGDYEKIIPMKELTEEEVDMIFELRDMGIAMGKLSAKLRGMNPNPPHGLTVEESGRIHESNRWISIGTTHLQQGLMAFTRSVTKTDSF